MILELLNVMNRRTLTADSNFDDNSASVRRAKNVAIENVHLEFPENSE